MIDFNYFARNIPIESLFYHVCDLEFNENQKNIIEFAESIGPMAHGSICLYDQLGETGFTTAAAFFLFKQVIATPLTTGYYIARTERERTEFQVLISYIDQTLGEVFDICFLRSNQILFQTTTDIHFGNGSKIILLNPSGNKRATINGSYIVMEDPAYYEMNSTPLIKTNMIDGIDFSEVSLNLEPVSCYYKLLLFSSRHSESTIYNDINNLSEFRRQQVVSIKSIKTS